MGAENMSDLILKIDNVSKKYGKTDIIKNVSLNLDAGKIIGLCGENGAGKTTLIKMIVGLLRDYKGNITVGGHEIGPGSKNIVSYQPDVVSLPKTLTGKQASTVYAEMYEDFDPLVLEGLFKKMRLD